MLWCGFLVFSLVLLILHAQLLHGGCQCSVTAPSVRKELLPGMEWNLGQLWMQEPHLRGSSSGLSLPCAVPQQNFWYPESHSLWSCISLLMSEPHTLKREGRAWISAPLCWWHCRRLLPLDSRAHPCSCSVWAALGISPPAPIQHKWCFMALVKQVKMQLQLCPDTSEEASFSVVFVSHVGENIISLAFSFNF